jgi:hypothetical protein
MILSIKGIRSKNEQIYMHLLVKYIKYKYMSHKKASLVLRVDLEAVMQFLS